MQFKVPQFIDVEDKIFGPLTFKQFIYLAGGVALCFIIWKIFPVIIALIFIGPVAALTFALTFVRINNKPFINILESFFRYSSGTKLYVWKKEPKAPGKDDDEIKASNETDPYLPKLSGSKLKDLAWSLDVLDANKK